MRGVVQEAAHFNITTCVFNVFTLRLHSFPFHLQCVCNRLHHVDIAFTQTPGFVQKRCKTKHFLCSHTHSNYAYTTFTLEYSMFTLRYDLFTFRLQCVHANSGSRWILPMSDCAELYRRPMTTEGFRPEESADHKCHGNNLVK